jgi:hypothetical protein
MAMLEGDDTFKVEPRARGIPAQANATVWTMNPQNCELNKPLIFAHHAASDILLG